MHSQRHLWRSIYNRPGVLLSLTALFWAGNFVIGRAVAGVIPPVALAMVRWALASMVFLPFAWPFLRRDTAGLRESWRIMIVLAVLGPGSFNTLTYIALISTEAINGLVLNAAAPIFIVVTAWGLFGDRIGRLQIAGLILGFMGVMVIVAKGDPVTLADFHFNHGDLILIFAMVTWSVYTSLLRKRPKVHWQSFSIVIYAQAALVNVPFAILENGQGFDPPNLWLAAAAVFYIAIFPSLLAYIFYNRGVELLGPSRAGVYMFLVPVFGSVLATIFLGEKLHFFDAAGFAMIAGGVLLGSGKASHSVPVAEGGKIIAEIAGENSISNSSGDSPPANSSTTLPSRKRIR